MKCAHTSLRTDGRSGFWRWILTLTIALGVAKSAAAQPLHGEKMVFQFSSLSFLQWTALASITPAKTVPMWIHVKVQRKVVLGAPTEIDGKVMLDPSNLLTQKIFYEAKRAEQTTIRAHHFLAENTSDYSIEWLERSSQKRSIPHAITLRDPLSAFLAVRAWAAASPAEDEIKLWVTDFAFSTVPFYYLFTVSRAGRNPGLVTRLGIVPVIRLKGEFVQVTAAGKPMSPGRSGRGTLYLSDDAELRPVRIEGHLGYEDATLELVDYTRASVPMPLPTSLPGAVCSAKAVPQPCLKSSAVGGLQHRQ